ncbi:hypothetical protein U9M48_008384 [Paspalum notatum var. saurae]|uniref:Uncharacterized protein n=1 Tax=Paspalum notatum var. saurae TaxID=547442 RepID=A0AAQ3WDG5_PASNO
MAAASPAPTPAAPHPPSPDAPRPVSPRRALTALHRPASSPPPHRRCTSGHLAVSPAAQHRPDPTPLSAPRDATRAPRRRIPAPDTPRPVRPGHAAPSCLAAAPVPHAPRVATTPAPPGHHPPAIKAP